MIKKIAFCSILTSLLLAVKYAFGFIPGVEFFTLLIIAYAIFLPFSWSVLIIPSAIFLIGVIYGFSSWWIMYWIIFGAMFLTSFFLKKILLKNNIIFGLWCGFNGISIMFWFALQDVVLYGQSYAIAQMSSALIVNSIEGFTNLIMGLLLFYPLKKIFKIMLMQFNHNTFISKRIVKKTLNV